MKQKLNCVLLIDDDEPTNVLTQMIIEESGHTTHIEVAQSGQEALEYLLKTKDNNTDSPSPDLIFLDINMPAMNGWEFLEEYKKLDLERKVIIVMLTTSLFPEDKTKADEMKEISAFENKPLTEENFEKIFNQYFSLSQQ